MQQSTTWMRATATAKFCVVLEIDNGSCVTACRGRWSTSETYETSPSTPPEAKRCVACWEHVQFWPGQLTHVYAVADRERFDLSDVDAFDNAPTLDMGGES